MATPTYATALSQINNFIVANGNNEITANVLNPVLKIILDFANNNIGDLTTLTTDETNTIVEAINSLKQNFEDLVNNGIQLHTGYDDPNVTPPADYNYGDFYMQLDSGDDSPIQLWQWNGFEWKDSSSNPATNSDNIENNSDVVGQNVTDALNNLLNSLPNEYTKAVYVNNNNPNSATIFDLNNPPTVNDNLLKSDVNNLYIGLDASTWVYNATSLDYVTKTITSATSNFYLYGTTTDAGNSKTADIERSGKLDLKGKLIVGLSRLGSFITSGRHLSQFNAGTDQTPIAISGGTSSIEYFKDLLTPRYAWATGLQNPSDNTDLKDSFKWFWAKPEIPAVPYIQVMKLSEEGNLYSKGNFGENITELTPTISGQPAIIKYVNSLNSTQPVKLVIYFHGSGANQLDPFTDPNSKYVIDKLLSEGYIVATSQAHGNAWGNQASQDDYLALYNYINSAYNITDVVYIGHSMGGLASLSMLSKNTIPKAKIWYGIMPVTNLADAYSVPAFITPIETAYSFSGGANYAAATAGYDPQLLVTSTYAGSKYTMTASASDVTVSKTNNSDLFSTKLTTGAIQSSVITATGVHGDISHFIPKSVYRFVQNVPIFTSEIGYLPRLDINGFYINSAILDDGVNLNLGRNTRLTGSTPTFSLINSASSNKRWDMRVNGASWMLTESGIGNQLVFAAGGVATFTNNVIVPNGTTSTHAVNKSQLDLKADITALPTSGFYASTPTIVTNVTSFSNIFLNTYQKIGSIVSVNANIRVNATSTGTTAFNITLPVNMTTAPTAGVIMGSGVALSGIPVPVFVKYLTTTTVQVTFVATASGSHDVNMIFSYSNL